MGQQQQSQERPGLLLHMQTCCRAFRTMTSCREVLVSGRTLLLQSLMLLLLHSSCCCRALAFCSPLAACPGLGGPNTPSTPSACAAFAATTVEVDAVAAVLGAEAAVADWALKPASEDHGFAALGARPIKRRRGDQEWALRWGAVVAVVEEVAGGWARWQGARAVAPTRCGLQCVGCLARAVLFEARLCVCVCSVASVPGTCRMLLAVHRLPALP
jgi:hypothetical protein